MHPEEQVNKSNQDVQVSRMNGDNGDNNGESLILLVALLRGYIPSLLLRLLRGMRCSIFDFSFLSGGYLVPLILLSDTCPFLPLVSLFSSFCFEVSGTYPFLFPRIHFFSEHSPSWNNVASGSNQNLSSIYFTGNNKGRIMFLAILP